MGKQPDKSIDLRGTPCPLNWVKTKLRLEQMQSGMLLEVILDDGLPVQNVCRSVTLEGHTIIETITLVDGVRLLIKRC